MKGLAAVLAAFAFVAMTWTPAAPAGTVSGVLTARPQEPVGTGETAGRHRLHAGTTATLYIPASVSPHTAAPFLLLLHGAGGRGDHMIRRFRAQADRRGIILLAPDSTDRSWDVALSMSGKGWTHPSFGADVKRLDTLLKAVFARVNADPQRTAVAGFSDGASMALSLGAHNVALFPATLAFSGGGIVPGWSGPSGRVFIAHGSEDAILPIAIVRDSVAPALSASGFTGTFVTFEGGHELPGPLMEQAMVWWLGP